MLADFKVVADALHGLGITLAAAQLPLLTSKDTLTGYCRYNELIKTSESFNRRVFTEMFAC